MFSTMSDRIYNDEETKDYDISVPDNIATSCDTNHDDMTIEQPKQKRILQKDMKLERSLYSTEVPYINLCPKLYDTDAPCYNLEKRNDIAICHIMEHPSVMNNMDSQHIQENVPYVHNHDEYSVENTKVVTQQQNNIMTIPDTSQNGIDETICEEMDSAIIPPENDISTHTDSDNDTSEEHIFGNIIEEKSPNSRRLESLLDYSFLIMNIPDFDSPVHHGHNDIQEQQEYQHNQIDTDSESDWEERWEAYNAMRMEEDILNTVSKTSESEWEERWEAYDAMKRAEDKENALHKTSDSIEDTNIDTTTTDENKTTNDILSDNEGKV